MAETPPTLKVRRLIVDGALGIDLTLNDGLNVLATNETDQRRTNRAGKTGLVELIQYGLGRNVRSRERFHFAPIQGSIDTLWLEMSCNGRVFTVRRSLQRHTGGVMVFPRPFEEALRKTEGDSMDLSAYSEFLLAQLRIPKVFVSTRDGELVGLTLPTLMRAFVLHQDDSFGAILDKVEPESRRADILGLLTGIRPKEAYELEVTRAEAVTRSQTLERSFVAVREFLAEQGIATREAAAERVRAAETAVAEIVRERQAEQERIRNVMSNAQQQGLSGESHLDVLRSQLLAVQARRTKQERDVLGARQEMARMRALIASLEADHAKARRLHASAEVLSTFDFQVCPRCVQEVTPDMRVRERYGRCSLCDRPLAFTSDAVPRAAPARADIEQQLSEARSLLEDTTAEAAAAERSLSELAGEERDLARIVNAETQVYVSPAVDTLLALSQKAGQREAELADAKRLLRQAEALQAMEEDLAVAKRKAEETDTALHNAQMRASRRLKQFEATYAAVLGDLEFPGIQRVEIDRSSLMPYLNGTLYLHSGAALRGLAIVGYHLALLRLSLEEKTYFPRFLVIDSPAVGDLNPASHDRLLRYLAGINSGAWEREEAKAPPYQMVLTTRRTVPDLLGQVLMTVSATKGEMLLRPKKR